MHVVGYTEAKCMTQSFRWAYSFIYMFNQTCRFSCMENINIGKKFVIRKMVMKSTCFTFPIPESSVAAEEIGCSLLYSNR